MNLLGSLAELILCIIPIFNLSPIFPTSAALSTIALRFLLETLCATSAAYRLQGE